LRSLYIWSITLPLLLLDDHGGEGEEKYRSCFLDMEEGWGVLKLSLGSSSTTTMTSLPSRLDGGWPLPPHLLASVFAGRRLKAMFNLQAAMPLRRPFHTVLPPPRPKWRPRQRSG
jgi:hypothetical protein